MNEEVKKIIKSLEGDLLVIGNFESEFFDLLNKNKSIKETYYLNSNDKKNNYESDDSLASVANNMDLKELHKYFKKGIDNIYCNFNEIKNYIPAFIRESLRVTKKNIYIVFEKKTNFKKIEKKYKRYGLNCSFVDNTAIIEANDIIIHWPKETYYYIKDCLEKAYNDVSVNV